MMVGIQLLLMFKRFHDKSTPNKLQKHNNNVTYTQIKKEQTARKLNYSQRHQKTKPELTEETISLTLECHKTNNYLFQGIVKGKTKVGQGALILKNGTAIFGTWNNDCLEGRALIFTPFRGKILANFNKGKLSGWTIAFYGTNIIRCTLYYENQIDGQKLTFDEKERMWVSSQCSPQGKILSIIHAEKGSKAELPSFIQSEELRDMFSRFAVMHEAFLDTEMLAQFQIGLTTSYIGFVDEERRPCGLGCAYSNQEIYCGNFFQGVLEHYGRMLFENGDIYQGELLAGSFWGTGMYYSPSTNETSIIISDDKEQRVQSEFEGYVLIDITPSLGMLKEGLESGIKGDALRKNIESLQPYYLKEFTNLKKVKVVTKSQASEYGHSQDMNSSKKEGKEKKDQAFEDLPSPSPSFKPKQGKNNEKWLKFQSNELQEIGLRKTMSLDKREAAQLKKIKQENAREFRFNQMKEDQLRSNGRSSSPKSSPKGAPVMKQIPFGKQFTLESQIKSGTEPINRIMTLNSSTGERKRGNDPNRHEQSDREPSEHSSFISGDSKKLAAIFDKDKSARKKIFY